MRSVIRKEKKKKERRSSRGGVVRRGVRQKKEDWLTTKQHESRGRKGGVKGELEE